MIRDAAETDIPELVRLRGLLFDSLSDAWGAAPPGEDWHAACARELRQGLTAGAMKVLVIDAGGGLAACGIGVLDRRLPGPYNPVGVVGHVFGVVTDPAYRGRGYARATTEALLAWLRSTGVTTVDLHATPEAEPLYRSLGFRDPDDRALTLRF